MNSMTTLTANGEAIRQAHKWRTLLLLALAELLAMAVWFSASAVVPALTRVWTLDDGGRAALTLSVQLGFVCGAFGSALLNLADRIPSRNFFTISALLAASATALIPFLNNGFVMAVILRFLTGVFLAGVYPVGIKIMATWTKADRGLGIGLLVGALTVGSALPHLLNAFGGVNDWQSVLSRGTVGGARWAERLCIRAGRTVPQGSSAVQLAVCGRNFFHSLTHAGKPGLSRSHVGAVRDVVVGAVISVGEFRRCWRKRQVGERGGFRRHCRRRGGSLLAGKWADRLGRTTITIASLSVSGSCALVVGFLYGTNPFLLVAICLVWGFAVVADSAQFSASISELCQREYIGTALTLQTSLGFLLTVVTIRLLPVIQSFAGWGAAFMFLTLGPIVGISAMWRLRHSPESKKLANGNR